MIASKVISSFLGFGAFGGVGATGVLYGPTVLQWSGLVDADGITYLVKTGNEGSTAKLFCASQHDKDIGVKLEKATGVSYNAKLSCDTEASKQSSETISLELYNTNKGQLACKKTDVSDRHKTLVCSVSKDSSKLTVKSLGSGKDPFVAFDWR
ncbi:hypothetical protein MHLP_01350 [Candidatus Mycoplasma haematolamae str. Purdue]|uniref:Uncharacterized protein n=1 Tax=Mycoplasma haematolamae (strain Purdue) TaxID=1212765 RepID=I7B993_MYCHA|nr:hypothetical protein [Candidatus Mycoplasma haematolamae]AFO51850.1 hypothetical protein MHLP_01350 [Candidatus Mycoplasma haematolamae str. Purdue]